MLVFTIQGDSNTILAKGVVPMTTILAVCTALSVNLVAQLVITYADYFSYSKKSYYICLIIYNIANV